VSFSYRYAKTQYAAVEALLNLATVAANRAGATKFWKVTLPDGSVAAFRGFVSKNDLPLEQEDGPACEAEITVTSKMTFTPYVAP
jgi:hypothetical protein